jgi:thiol-disulfide isomerase/thioredoxin
MAIIVLMASHFLLLANGTNGPLKWETDWKQTLKTAAANKQPVLMDFYTDWCPPCKKLAAVTFKDDKMINYFNKENYVMIKVNPEKDREAESKFKVYSYPTLLIFNPNGKEIDRLLGFKTTGEMIKALEDLKKGIGTLEDLLNKFKKYKKEDKSAEKIKLMFAVNDKYIARADYPQALEMIDRIIELDKDNSKKQAAAAMYQRGYVYYKWKKYKKAVDALVAIHKVYPQSEEAESAYSAAVSYSESPKTRPST